jgi:hypothetical protein
MPLDEKQLEALIAATVKKAVADTTAAVTSALTAKFEAAHKGLVANRDQILKELKTAQGKTVDDDVIARYKAMSAKDVAKLSVAEDKARLDALYPKSDDTASRWADSVLKPRNDIGTPLKEVILSRDEARDAQKYQAAKALAQRENVPLRIDGFVEQTPAYVRGPESVVKKIETDNAVFISDAYRRRIGAQAAQNMGKGKTVIVFRSPDELPREAQAQHKAILDAQNPEDLLFDEGAEK